MEHIRASEYPGRPSRLNCAYFLDNERTARAYQAQHAPFSLLYEVEPLDRSVNMFRANYDANQPDHMPTLDWCRRYWMGDIFPVPHDGITRIEILAVTPLRVVGLL